MWTPSIWTPRPTPWMHHGVRGTHSPCCSPEARTYRTGEDPSFTARVPGLLYVAIGVFLAHLKE